MINNFTPTAFAGRAHHDPCDSVFSNSKLLLSPTATMWSLSCDATDEVAIRRLTKLRNAPIGMDYEVLVASPIMLHRYVKEVPPRIETLLAYLQRPLTLELEPNDLLPAYLQSPQGKVYFRLAQNEFEQDLVAQAEGPVLLAYALQSNGSYAASFGTVSSSILEGVDKVLHHVVVNSTNEPSVIAKMGAKEELEFLRS